MEQHIPIEEFRERFGSLSRKRFLAQFPSPLLLIEMRGRKKSDGLSDFAKTSNPKGPTLPAVRLESAVMETRIAPVEKSGRNDFPNAIAVGRDSTNDIVLSHPSISKFHAVFRRDPNGRGLAVWDVGSMNGTSVDGRLLGEGDWAPLESGMPIIFGKSVQGTYFSAEEFHDYLKLLDRLRGSAAGDR
jgi:hypothetical protein